MWRNLIVGNTLGLLTTLRCNNAIRVEIRDYSTTKNQIKIPAVFMRVNQIKIAQSVIYKKTLKIF